MKQTLFVILFFAAVLLPGCLTIEEKYHFNRDGSGTMEYSIDIRDLVNMLDAAGDTLSRKRFQPDNIFMEAGDRLRDIQGISHITITHDEEPFVFGIQYEFSDINALNNALNQLLNGEEETYHAYFKRKRRKIIREHKTDSRLTSSNLLGKVDETDESAELFRDIIYRIQLGFERRVRRVRSEGDWTKSPNGHAVTTESNFLEISRNPDILDIKVKTR